MWKAGGKEKKEGEEEEGEDKREERRSCEGLLGYGLVREGYGHRGEKRKKREGKRGVEEGDIVDVCVVGGVEEEEREGEWEGLSYRPRCRSVLVMQTVTTLGEEEEERREREKRERKKKEKREKKEEKKRRAKRSGSGKQKEEGGESEEEEEEEGVCVYEYEHSDDVMGEYVLIRSSLEADGSDLPEAQYQGLRKSWVVRLFDLLYDIINPTYQRISIFAIFLIIFIFPCLLVVILYGLLPCDLCFTSIGPDGEPGQLTPWRFYLSIFLIDPLQKAVYSLILIAIFRYCLDDHIPWKPARAYLHIPLMVFIVSSAVMGSSFYLCSRSSPYFTASASSSSYLYAYWPLNGLVYFLLMFVTVLVGLRLRDPLAFYCPRKVYMQRLWSFTLVLAVLFGFIILLAVYVVVFALSGNSFVQIILSVFVISLGGTIFQAILLALTEPFGIEVAMIISGFWQENLGDIFQTMAYPSVDTPSVTYAIMFLLKLVGNLYCLLLLSNYWFNLRRWVLKKVAIVFPCCILPDVDEEEDHHDDRGNTFIKPGYHRRIIRFFFLKLYSQLCSNTFYLTVTPLFRWGLGIYADYNTQTRFSPNTDPFTANTLLAKQVASSVTDEQFRYSLFFCGIKILSVFISAGIGYLYVRGKFPRLYEELHRTLRSFMGRAEYASLILAIFYFNCCISIEFMEYHNRVFFI
eukprot:Nk52_evm11s32 gene=Nk52_evmTU11s32